MDTGGGQQGFQGLKTILSRHADGAPGFELLDIARERFVVGGVQFKQFEAVARFMAHQTLDDEGRARVDPGAAFVVETGHHVQVVFQGFDLLLGRQTLEFEHPIGRFATFFCVVPV